LEEINLYQENHFITSTERIKVNEKKWRHINFVKYRNFRAKQRYELWFQPNNI